MPTIALMLRNNQRTFYINAMHLCFLCLNFFAVQGECVGLYLPYHI